MVELVIDVSYPTVLPPHGLHYWDELGMHCNVVVFEKLHDNMFMLIVSFLEDATVVLMLLTSVNLETTKIIH